MVVPNKFAPVFSIDFGHVLPYGTDGGLDALQHHLGDLHSSTDNFNPDIAQLPNETPHQISTQTHRRLQISANNTCRPCWSCWLGVNFISRGSTGCASCTGGAGGRCGTGGCGGTGGRGGTGSRGGAGGTGGPGGGTGAQGRVRTEGVGVGGRRADDLVGLVVVAEAVADQDGGGGRGRRGAVDWV